MQTSVQSSSSKTLAQSETHFLNSGMRTYLQSPAFLIAGLRERYHTNQPGTFQLQNTGCEVLEKEQPRSGAWHLRCHQEAGTRGQSSVLTSPCRGHSSPDVFGKTESTGKPASPSLGLVPTPRQVHPLPQSPQANLRTVSQFLHKAWLLPHAARALPSHVSYSCPSPAGLGHPPRLTHCQRAPRNPRVHTLSLHGNILQKCSLPEDRSSWKARSYLSHLSIPTNACCTDSPAAYTLPMVYVPHRPVRTGLQLRS